MIQIYTSCCLHFFYYYVNKGKMKKTKILHLLVVLKCCSGPLTRGQYWQWPQDNLSLSHQMFTNQSRLLVENRMQTTLETMR